MSNLRNQASQHAVSNNSHEFVGVCTNDQLRPTVPASVSADSRAATASAKIVRNFLCTVHLSYFRSDSCLQVLLLSTFALTQSLCLPWHARPQTLPSPPWPTALLTSRYPEPWSPADAFSPPRPEHSPSLRALRRGRTRPAPVPRAVPYISKGINTHSCFQVWLQCTKEFEMSYKCNNIGVQQAVLSRCDCLVRRSTLCTHSISVSALARSASNPAFAALSFSAIAWFRSDSACACALRSFLHQQWGRSVKTHTQLDTE